MTYSKTNSFIIGVREFYCNAMCSFSDRCVFLYYSILILLNFVTVQSVMFVCNVLVLILFVCFYYTM